MQRLLFQGREASSTVTARTLRHQVQAVLDNAVPPVAIRRRILLVLAEAVNNLVEHAAPHAATVEVSFGSDDQGWWLDIHDDGRPWNPLSHDSDEATATVDPSPRGRGIGLMKSQSDTLSYAAETGRNRLRATWRKPDTDGRRRILIVDDDATQLRLLSAYLANTFDTITAGDGQEALDYLRTTPVDLVLSDIQMPGLNGIALRERLNQDRRQRTTPFILLTGHDDEALVRRATAAGIDDFLRKPADSRSLHHVIERVLQRSRQVRQAIDDRLDSQISGALAVRPPPAQAGWRFAALHHNTGSGGGDFLLHRCIDDHVLVVLADTMGHDDEAKFFSHAYAGYLHGFLYACERPVPPAELLRRLSAAAYAEKLFSQVLLTCIAVSLGPDGEVAIASAGHPPALLIGDTQVAAVPTEGVVPGLLPDSRYEARHLKLSKGQRLALYTDGLVESAGDQAGRRHLEQQLIRSLDETRHADVTCAAATLSTRFVAAVGPRPTDDASLILIERAG